MNWHLKFNYVCVEDPIPYGSPSSYFEYVVTDSIDKINFPSSDTDIRFKGANYRLSSVEITLTDIKIVV